MIKVTAVRPESIAAELGLVPGSELVSIDGRELEDFLDWEFLSAEERFLLHVRQPDGTEVEFDIERPLEEGMGLSLEPVRIRRCANRCDFCFVDGLPEGLREVLYIRDDPEKSVPPTPYQIKAVIVIEKILGVKFKGKSKFDARQFIEAYSIRAQIVAHKEKTS
jgi:hypothetical protein